MKEPNKISYAQMIELLQKQVHQAPDTWQHIEEEVSFNQGLSNLKKYKAPDNIWDKIENDLDNQEKSKASQHNYLRTGSAIIIIVSLLFLMTNYIKTKNKVNAFVYSSQIEINENNIPEIETDNQAFSSGIDFINTNESNFSKESFNSYKEQLLELESAIEKLNLMQEQYGEDSSSIKMLSKLEREKADLIKSMINRA